MNEKVEEGSPNAFLEFRKDLSSQIVEIQVQSRVKPESIHRHIHLKLLSTDQSTNPKTQVFKKREQRQC